jgi:hypothetical protein
MRHGLISIYGGQEGDSSRRRRPESASVAVQKEHILDIDLRVVTADLGGTVWRYPYEIGFAKLMLKPRWN